MNSRTMNHGGSVGRRTREQTDAVVSVHQKRLCSRKSETLICIKQKDCSEHILSLCESLYSDKLKGREEIKERSSVFSGKD